MSLTIQIVNYNSRDNLIVCLQSTREHVRDGADFQVIVVNNDKGSLGGFLNDFDIDLIEKNENVGFGKAHNLGLERAKGEYVLLLNPDTKLFPGAIAKLIDVFSADERIGIAGPLHISEEGVSKEEHFGFQKTPLSTIGGKLFGKQSLLSRKSVFETDWVSGGAMMIRKKLFRELGGFDEKYFMYFEDVDLCLRAKKKGWKVVVQPEAKVFHKSGQSFTDNRQKKKYYYDSQGYYLQKNFGLIWSWVARALRLPFYFWNVYFKKR